MYLGKGAGVQPCESTEALSPKQGLDEAKLETLTRKQNIGPRYELSSQIGKLITHFITESNFHKSLSSTISYNSAECRDTVFCYKAHYMNTGVRRELDRQNLGIVGIFLNNIQVGMAMAVEERNDVSEVYSVPRVTKVAASAKLRREEDVG